MTLKIQKFGGTSVGNIDKISRVARWAIECSRKGDQIVLVVSAMSGETARLIQLATEINAVPYSREYDFLLASGEQVSAGLVSLAINTIAEREGFIQKGSFMARPFLGYQIGMRTDSAFSKARIQDIDTSLLQAEVDAGRIPVIAGFQGVDAHNNITTLGRGGSDTSAVAIAAAMKADVCEIYTDVDGVYTTDPRICEQARKIDQISYEEMMELSSLGAKVLQIRSVELAAKYSLPVHVRSSFVMNEGTWVMPNEELESRGLEKVLVSGVAIDLSQVKLTIRNLPRKPDAMSKVFSALSDASIVVDVIVQDMSSKGSWNVSFTVSRADFEGARSVLTDLKSNTYPDLELTDERDLAKLSIVGVGMQHHPGVASKMFQILADLGIETRLVTTSEIKVSCLIDSANAKQAVVALHEGFGLNRDQ